MEEWNVRQHTSLHDGEHQDQIAETVAHHGIPQPSRLVIDKRHDHSHGKRSQELRKIPVPDSEDHCAENGSSPDRYKLFGHAEDKSTECGFLHQRCGNCQDDHTADGGVGNGKLVNDPGRCIFLHRIQNAQRHAVYQRHECYNHKAHAISCCPFGNGTSGKQLLPIPQQGGKIDGEQDAEQFCCNNAKDDIAACQLEEYDVKNGDCGNERSQTPVLFRVASGERVLPWQKRQTAVCQQHRRKCGQIARQRDVVEHLNSPFAEEVDEGLRVVIKESVS